MQNNQKTQRGTLKNSKKSRTVPKNRKGDPLVSSRFVSYVKKVKNERGGPLETKKIWKVAQCRKKSQGGLFSRIQFCRLLWKKMKGGTLCTKFALAPWPDLALGGFSDVPKKWTYQCEWCGLKKKSHCYSRAFFLKRKTRRLKNISFSLFLSLSLSLSLWIDIM